MEARLDLMNNDLAAKVVKHIVSANKAVMIRPCRRQPRNW